MPYYWILFILVCTLEHIEYRHSAHTHTHTHVCPVLARWVCPTLVPPPLLRLGCLVEGRKLLFVVVSTVGLSVSFLCQLHVVQGKRSLSMSI